MGRKKTAAKMSAGATTWAAQGAENPGRSWSNFFDYSCQFKL